MEKCFCVDTYQEVEKEKNFRPHCRGEVENFNNNYYCLMHSPNPEKSSEKFCEHIKEKIDFKDYNFRGYYFPAGFDFDKAIFESKVNFRNCNFKKVKFKRCVFCSDASFSRAIFEGKADFSHARFDARVHFRRGKFMGEADFSYSYINSYFIFEGEENNLVFDEKATLKLSNARIEKPERVFFRSLRLYPRWFVKVDSRELFFSNICWENKSLKSIKEDIEITEIHNLIIAYRQLAQNAEDNKDFERASDFRRMAFETEWVEKKRNFWNWLNGLADESEKLKRRFGGSEIKEDEAAPPTNSFGIAQNFDFVHLLYRITSYYGESWRLAAVVLVLILGISAFFYAQTDFIVCNQDVSATGAKAEKCEVRKLGYYDGVRHSFSTAVLQRSEKRIPKNETAEWIMTTETILAPIQFALLALAVRRRFIL